MLYHWNPATFEALPWWLINLTSNGYEAVGFFFVLSGFVLTYSYFDPASHSSLRSSDRLFWIARFARIYPVYCLAFILCAPIVLYSVFVAHTTHPGLVVGSLFLVPLLLQAWVPNLALGWNGPAWSLSVEAVFYACFPWLLRRSRNASAAWLACASLVAVTLVAVVRLFMRDSTPLIIPCSSTAWRNFWDFWPLVHLPSFAFGVALGRLFLEGRHSKLRCWTVLFVCSLAALIVLFALRTSLPRVLMSNVVLVPLFGVLILSSVNAPSYATGFLHHPMLITLGEASYSIYMLHAPVRTYFINIAEWAGFDPAGWPVHLTYWLVLLGLCVAVFYLLEAPARRYISRTLGSVQVSGRAGVTKTSNIQSA